MVLIGGYFSKSVDLFMDFHVTVSALPQKCLSSEPAQEKLRHQKSERTLGWAGRDTGLPTPLQIQYFNSFMCMDSFNLQSLFHA